MQEQVRTYTQLNPLNVKKEAYSLAYLACPTRKEVSR